MRTVLLHRLKTMPLLKPVPSQADIEAVLKVVAEHREPDSYLLKSEFEKDVDVEGWKAYRYERAC
jgi:hypothetical protein